MKPETADRRLRFSCLAEWASHTCWLVALQDRTVDTESYIAHISYVAYGSDMQGLPGYRFPVVAAMHMTIADARSTNFTFYEGDEMRGLGNSKGVPRLAGASSTKITIEGKLFSAILTHPDEIRLHQKVRVLRLQPGEMCWCRITDVPRLSRGGWRPVIVESDNEELAVFSDMTGQLVLLSKQAFATLPHRAKGPKLSRGLHSLMKRQADRARTHRKIQN